MRRLMMLLFWILLQECNAAKKNHLRPLASARREERKVGCMIVGIGGNNGVTCMAGLLANKKKLSWEGEKRKVEADWTGCITQNEYAEYCAYLDNAEISGWEIRETKLGDALSEARILDRELVRRLKDEMNHIAVLPGIWDKRYIGESQHATATYVYEAKSHLEKLDKIRRDIRDFKKKVNGHTTVIWSASVEAPSMLTPSQTATAAALFDTLKNENAPVPPSVLYALAAALEGCSFVNGGSQNTAGECPGLLECFTESYCLGTDFKAGQTKFKTAAVEYLQHNGFNVRVVASANHLGNNDMKSLLGAKQQGAKLKVKHDIFPNANSRRRKNTLSPPPPIEHVVSVMYTPYIGDEKRDYVEYTSEAFLSQLHTMVTYTRCSDSVLCAPLMLDACIWCDALRSAAVPRPEASRALAYLFKQSPDPESFFFFDQLRRLDHVCHTYLHQNRHIIKLPDDSTGSTSAPPAENNVAAAIVPPRRHDGKKLVVAAGLACLDIELLGASNIHIEAINQYTGSQARAGGSAPQVATALAAIGQPCAVVSRLGQDASAGKLLQLLEAPELGGLCLPACTASDSLPTGNAIVPVYVEGGRGCFFDAGANREFGVEDIVSALWRLRDVACLHIGYPHLLPQCRGPQLASLLPRLDVLTSLDLNGVPSDAFLGDGIIDAPASVADIIHANTDEARTLLQPFLPSSSSVEQNVENLALLLQQHTNSALAVVTDGTNGAAIAVTSDAERIAASKLPDEWLAQTSRIPAYELPPNTLPNANGAGDAFCAGLISAILLRLDGDSTITLDQVGRLASLSAYMRVASLPPRLLTEWLNDIRLAQRAAHHRRGFFGVGGSSSDSHDDAHLPPEIPLVSSS